MNDLRLIILEAMLLIEKDNDSGKYVIDDVLEKYSYLDKQQKGFIKRILEGTLERRIELDYTINQYSKVKVNKQKPVIRNILRMGIYQLKYMDSIPASAVCNEAVKLTKKKKFTGLTGFVNGVLRTASRNNVEISLPEDINECLSVKYSCPKWLVDEFVENYGIEKATLMLNDSLEERPLYVRVNLSKASVEEIKNQFAKQGIECYEVEEIPYALKISKVGSVEELEGFNKGLFQIQDLSSMLVVELASIKHGDTVLDVCAAPGGKTMHALDVLNGSGCVYAFDISEKKLELIKNNSVRNGFNSLKIEKKDAMEYDASYKNIADVLIADLPCSGLGVLGRKNDIKYNASPKSLNELVELQRKILTNIAAYVKPGGILMFSTCTVNPRENVDNYRWILENLGFEYVPFDGQLPKRFDHDTAKLGYLQLLQGIDGTDGFFISKFVKKQ